MCDSRLVALLRGAANMDTFDIGILIHLTDRVSAGRGACAINEIMLEASI